jgi:hypothetical protein
MICAEFGLSTVNFVLLLLLLLKKLILDRSALYFPYLKRQ